MPTRHTHNSGQWDGLPTAYPRGTNLRKSTHDTHTQRQNQAPRAKGLTASLRPHAPGKGAHAPCQDSLHTGEWFFSRESGDSRVRRLTSYSSILVLDVCAPCKYLGLSIFYHRRLTAEYLEWYPLSTLSPCSGLGRACRRRSPPRATTASPRRTASGKGQHRAPARHRVHRCPLSRALCILLLKTLAKATRGHRGALRGTAGHDSTHSMVSLGRASPHASLFFPQTPASNPPRRQI